MGLWNMLGEKEQIMEDAWGQADEVEEEKAVKTNFFNNSV